MAMKKYRDYYFLKAKEESYPARSVYKLQEMDKRFQLFKEARTVLDLGAAPGSWTLYAAKQVGHLGMVVAVDLSRIEVALPAHARAFQDDVFEPSEALTATLAEVGPFDLVMSDMAPKTSGVKFSDQARSFDLASRAFEMAREHLAEGGNFVVKIFLGPDVKSLVDAMRPWFASVKTFKPQSSRAESKEQFILGLGARGNTLPPEETDDGRT